MMQQGQVQDILQNINQISNQTQLQFNQQEQENQQNNTHVLNPQQQQISNAVSEINTNQRSIVIHVSNPIEIKKSKLKNYVVYTIKGVDAWGEFQTQRRFKEFYALRISLIQFWYGFYIPPLPDKIMNPNSDQLRERLKLLNYFVESISKIEYLYYSVQSAKIFLRSIETKICKTLKGLTPPSLLYQIQVAKQIFQITQENYDEQMLQNSLKNVQVFLHRSKIILHNLSEQTKQMINSNRKLKEQIKQFIGNELEQSEKFILPNCLENEDGRINNNEMDLQIISNLENMIKNRDIQLENFHNFIKVEIKDIDAYLEGIQIRENIVKKQNYENIKLKYWQFEKKENELRYDYHKGQFKFDPTNQNIEEHINQCNKDIRIFNHFNLFMISLSITKVFEKFKNDKQQFYKRIIKEIAQLELENLSIMQQSWNSIANLALLKRDIK